VRKSVLHTSHVHQSAAAEPELDDMAWLDVHGTTIRSRKRNPVSFEWLMQSRRHVDEKDFAVSWVAQELSVEMRK
jgi:hypothetical protein